MDNARGLEVVERLRPLKQPSVDLGLTSIKKGASSTKN